MFPEREFVITDLVDLWGVVLDQSLNRNSVSRSIGLVGPIDGQGVAIERFAPALRSSIHWPRAMKFVLVDNDWAVCCNGWGGFSSQKASVRICY